jgi:hypothetical protein
MTPEPNVQLLGQIGLVAWVSGHVARDLLKILGEVLTAGIRLVKILKEELRS